MCVYVPNATYSVLGEVDGVSISSGFQLHCSPEIEQSEKAKYRLYRLCDSGLLPELNMAAAAFLQNSL